jgi:hypothetical protein
MARRRIITAELERELLRALAMEMEEGALSPDEVREQLLQAVRARGQAETTERASVQSAAQRLDAARAELRAARRRFAALTQPRHQRPYRSRKWARLVPVLRAAEAEFLPRPGVLAVSLGYRRRAGVTTEDEVVVTVFVRKKYPPEEVEGGPGAVVPPRVEVSGTGLPTDVVGLGDFHETAAGGDSVGPKGVAVGATIGCFGEDEESRRPVALTVMHLLTQAGITPSLDIRFVSPSAPVGTLPFGSYLRGTTERVDAMAIALDSNVLPTREIHGIGPILGWRPLVDPADRLIFVQMYGSATGEATGERAIGRVEYPSVPLPELGLDDAILVSMPVLDGDSGAALVDGDRYVLGLLKGYYTGGNRLAVFTPIGAVLARLGCWMP